MVDAPAPGAPAAPAPGAPAAPAPPPGGTPWHQGVEADTLGFWTNKGYKTEDPKAVATELTKQYRELERHFGVPPERLAKLPGADSKPEDVKAFWSKLGVPNEAKDYDFSGVKFNGKDLEDSFVASLRTAMATAQVAKDKAPVIAQSFLNWLQDAELQSQTVTTARIAKEKSELEKSWGVNHQFNLLMADQGARRFGISNEEFARMGEVLGVGRASEMFRQIGEGLKEDGLVTAGSAPGQGGPPRTAEGAQQRLAELEKNSDWRSRITTGKATPAELEEFYALNAQAAGEQRII